jgi:hypothetical protein
MGSNGVPKFASVLHRFHFGGIGWYMSEPREHTTPPTKEQLWAKGLDAEQVAARLIALADDLKALPDRAQRQALWREAAARIFDGTPVWKATKLPTGKEMAALTGPPAPAEAEGESAVNPTGREGRGRRKATGDPRADRAAQAKREGAA